VKFKIFYSKSFFKPAESLWWDECNTATPSHYTVCSAHYQIKKRENEWRNMCLWLL